MTSPPDTRSTPTSPTASTRRPPRLGSRGIVALAALFTVMLRLPFFAGPLSPDESGLLIIAQNWSEGPFLYGDYFVGRGIVVIALYALADVFGGWVGLRLLGILVAVTMVVAAGWAGHQLRGRRGAGWAAFVAAAYSSTYFFSSISTNERLLGAAIVMLSCAVTLRALRGRGSLPLAVLAGVLAALSVLVVQSYVDGFVFATVLLVASVATGRVAPATALRVAVGGVLGTLVVLGVLAVLFATTWMTWEQFWFQMAGYRIEASVVVREGAVMPVERLRTMAKLVTWTGAVVLVLGLLTGARTARAHGKVAEWVAVVAVLALVVVSMVAGGDYWPDYMLQAIPALAMAAGLLAPAGTWTGLVMRLGASTAVVAAVVAAYIALTNPFLGSGTTEAATGRWLAAAKEPDDTAVVVFGKANVLHNAGMTGPYPYMWSLLTRTLDPELDLLAETLRGPDAPTWLVSWHGPDTWDLDDGDRVAGIIREEYALVGSPCGVDVYLLRGESRDLLPSADCD